MDRKFPRLVIRRDKLRNNFTQVITRCRTQGISVAGVVKGVNGLPEIARLYKECGARQLATSRLEQIAQCRAAGIDRAVAQRGHFGPVSAHPRTSHERAGGSSASGGLLPAE